MANRRASFNNIKGLLYKRGVRFGMIYPARLHYIIFLSLLFFSFFLRLHGAYGACVFVGLCVNSLIIVLNSLFVGVNITTQSVVIKFFWQLVMSKWTRIRRVFVFLFSMFWKCSGVMFDGGLFFLTWFLMLSLSHANMIELKKALFFLFFTQVGLLCSTLQIHE